MDNPKYELFTVGDSISKGRDPLNVLAQTGAPRLMPATNMGLIDVVEDFPWTLTPRAARNETPSIELVEWSLKASALIGAFNRYGYQFMHLSEKSTFPYFALYPADKTGFWYTLPYFSDVYRTIVNQWDSSDALSTVPFANRIPKVGKLVGEYIGINGIEALAKAFSVNVGHEIPLGYTGTSRESIDVLFVLLNTTSAKDVQRNWEFIYLFSYQNSQNRKNYIVVDPPKFYTVRIEGVKYSPAMFVSNLQIGNLGQIKRVMLNGRLQNIPEAWTVKISLTDLIPHSQNMLEAMRDGRFTQIEATQGETIEEFFFGKNPQPDIGLQSPDSRGEPVLS